jgi:phytol kinase
MSPVIRSILGIVLSYVFVFGFIGLATLFLKRGRLAPTATRKVIHIGVSHWWLIAMALISNPWVASIGPATFIVINAIALRKRMLPAMDEGADSRNAGTVYFPITLLVLVNLCWRGIVPVWLGGTAVLVLGWGDGLAALVGERFRNPGFTSFGGRKSLAGTSVMFAASFIVTLVFTLLFNASWSGLAAALGVSAAVAAVATIVEVITPLGIDNLTVPLAVVAFYAWVFL